MPELSANNLVNLTKYNIYLKLMIDGMAGRPFSAETLPPFLKPQESSKEKIIKVSRERYSTPRETIEDKISRWSGNTEKMPTSPPATSQQVLYDARCADCGKWTKIIFPPDGKRPIYCKTCLKKIHPAGPHETREKPRQTYSNPPEVKKSEPCGTRRTFEELPTVSLKEALESEPVSFSSSRKERKRKEVDVEELKKAIGESLKEKSEGKTEKPAVQKGEIKPGETVKFE